MQRFLAISLITCFMAAAAEPAPAGSLIPRPATTFNETEAAKAFAETTSEQQDAQSPQTSTPKAASKPSNKKKWIIVGVCVGAGVLAGLLVLDKRLGNEGKPIFGR